MKFLFTTLLASTATAAVINTNREYGSPRIKVVPEVPSSTSFPTESTTVSSFSSTVEGSTITAAPSQLEAKVKDNCTPLSICFDGLSCGIRYGGCYDKNFCGGKTSSLSVPTC
ncbi:hypothetical protein D0867_05425 [Hortaea werneckii]|uniref:Chitin-binding type-1 domain-containing protein n=1 Tax=Hortaea werneckii TaxID=91943 RepID=A0A3M6ZSR8_HORWE|nr:hypothetical protein D0867_05425 [Hortaea werneckii]RMY33997.1 hypothetical protein D0866_05554 [Hortaea werneckii]